MNHDHLDPINALYMPEMADATFATDFLSRAKQGVRNIAFALTETASPEVRELLKKMLTQAIALHQEITALMIEKKWFHPYELGEQYKLDQLSANNITLIGKMKLFPADTSRKGMFDQAPDESSKASELEHESRNIPRR
ncbi:spore coat protein [Paenibacillus stellifer]|uniref:spore coat protein n=1 Tax=Paenibacillus stellifer TaxID=169760 RepID=UPI000689AB61|nr:spore coat protein [Paenibacillus stellifer]